jgi:hypothetical protein
MSGVNLHRKQVDIMPHCKQSWIQFIYFSLKENEPCAVASFILMHINLSTKINGQINICV